jgi:hypothetical protein
MKFEFHCYGHENILSLHRNTIEFTKDTNLTKNGDCIVGVNSDFNYDELIKFVKAAGNKKISARIIFDGMQDNFCFFINDSFKDEREIVIRKSDFLSKRTLGVHADKAAKDLDKNLIEKLKSEDSKFKVVFQYEEEKSE